MAVEACCSAWKRRKKSSLGRGSQLCDHCLLNLFVAKIFVLIKRKEIIFFCSMGRVPDLYALQSMENPSLKPWSFSEEASLEITDEILGYLDFVLLPRLFSYLPIRTQGTWSLSPFFFALMKNKLFEVNDLGSWIGGHYELSGEFGAGWILFEPQHRLIVKQVIAVKKSSKK